MLPKFSSTLHEYDSRFGLSGKNTLRSGPHLFVGGKTLLDAFPNIFDQIKVLVSVSLSLSLITFWGIYSSFKFMETGILTIHSFSSLSPSYERIISLNYLKE